MFSPNPYDITLPTFPKPASPAKSTFTESTQQIAQNWLSQFSTALSANSSAHVLSLLHDLSWWRDHLTLTWDYRTLHPSQKIGLFLTSHLPSAAFTNLRLQETGKFVPRLTKPVEGQEWLEFMFHFETRVGKGKGMVRLAEGRNGVWKALLVYTALQELKGFEEIAGTRRPNGGKNSLEGGIVKGNWLERREREQEFLDEEPTILVIGAGNLLLLL